MAELITMVKNSHRKIIMDLSPKAACSVMVAMFFDSMDIRQDINYTGFIHRYRGEVFYPRYGHVTMEELLDTSLLMLQVQSGSQSIRSYGILTHACGGK